LPRAIINSGPPLRVGQVELGHLGVDRALHVEAHLPEKKADAVADLVFGPVVERRVPLAGGRGSATGAARRADLVAMAAM
jgi:hypothetical protein